MEIDVGRLVAGKYELVRLIGKGAMGEVWLATHNSLGGEFAIKLVKPSADDHDENAAARFQLEAQISARLSRRTRHIISVSDHGEEDGLAYLVMELLEGESLEARIATNGKLSLAETVAIVMQITRALEQAHAEGVFHRDLKPANVFLTRDEDGRLLVKLLDFGIARSTKPFRTRSPVMTGKNMVLGTPSYMSPEQARGLESLDHRCDLWALAVLAYESLTGDIPWEGSTIEDIFLDICTHRVRPIHSLRPDLPPALESVFARSFAVELEDRYATAKELSEAIELLVDPDLVDAATGKRPVPPSARRMQSDNDLASAMAMAPAQDGTDAHGVAATEVMRRRRSGWLMAAIAAVVTIGVILLGLRLLTTRDATASVTPPNNPVTPGPSAAAPAPPVVTAPTPSDGPISTPVVTTTAKPPVAINTAKPPVVTTTAKPPIAKAPPPPQRSPPTVQPAPPPPPPVAPPLAPVPPPAPVHSAPPAGPPDRSGVF